MVIDIDKYVDFLCLHKLSTSQFLILWLIYIKDQNNINKTQEKGLFSKHDLEYLIDTKFLLNYGSKINIIDYTVSEKFTKAILIDEDDAYEELCSVYPPWMIVKGVKWPMIKGDPYKIAKEYYKCHKGNKLSHERIYSITERYFKTNPVQGNIEDYILNRRWNLLEEDLQKSGGLQDAFKTL